MKKLIRRSAWALALGAVVLGLTSCGPKNTPSTTMADPAGTVTWWNNYQDPTAQADYNEEVYRKKSNYSEYFFAKDAIDAFEKEHPNIHVIQKNYGSYPAVKSAVDAGLSTGDIPDLASCYPDSVASWESADVSLDVTPYLTSENVGFGKKAVYNAEDKTTSYADDSTTSYDDFNKSYIDAESGMYNGKLYSMPFSKSSETLAVNKTVFEQNGAGVSGTATETYKAPVAAATKKPYKVPENFTELITLARQMKLDYPEVFANQRDKDGYFTAVPFCWDSTENMAITLLKDMGIGYTDGTKEGADSILFNNEDTVKLFTQLKKWNNEGLIATQNQLPITNAAKNYHQYSSNMFTGGSIFMCVSSTAGASYFAADGLVASMNHVPNIDSSIYESGAKFTSDVKASTGYAISQGPSLAFLIHGDSAEQSATWEFYKYLTNTKNSAALAVAKSYIPIRTSAYSEPSVKAYTDAASASLTTEDKYATKRNSYTGQVWDLAGEYSKNGNLFLSDVFEYSSKARTELGNALTAILDSKVTSDADIENLVRTQLQAAYDNVLK